MKNLYDGNNPKLRRRELATEAEARERGRGGQCPRLLLRWTKSSSKEQIDAQLAEVSELASQMGYHFVKQRIADIGIFVTAESLGGGGSVIIKGLKLIGSTLNSMQAYGPESQKIKEEWDKASTTLRDMIEKINPHPTKRV